MFLCELVYFEAQSRHVAGLAVHGDLKMAMCPHELFHSLSQSVAAITAPKQLAALLDSE